MSPWFKFLFGFDRLNLAGFGLSELGSSYVRKMFGLGKFVRKQEQAQGRKEAAYAERPAGSDESIMFYEETCGTVRNFKFCVVQLPE